MVNRSSSGESKGFLIVLAVLAFVIAFVLPLTAIMYMDILAVRSVVHEELRKTVLLRKQLQKQLSEQKEGSDD